LRSGGGAVIVIGLSDNVWAELEWNFQQFTLGFWCYASDEWGFLEIGFGFFRFAIHVE
jgi:hypothetical protein